MKLHRREISNDLGLAASFGDLRENAEFEATKDYEHVFLQRMSRIEKIIVNARIIGEEDIDTNKINVGTVVTLLLPKTKISKYALLDSIEAELDIWAGDFKYASIESPIAQSIFGFKVGELISLPTEIEAEIKAIEPIFQYRRRDE